MGLCGIGASIGMAIVQRAAAGLISEQPDKYAKTLVFQLIPTTAALYGFVVAFLIMQNMGMGGESYYSTQQGLLVLASCFPIGIVGMISSICQARVCAAGIMMIGKREGTYGRALTMAIFIEFFALLSLMVSVLAVLAI